MEEPGAASGGEPRPRGGRDAAVLTAGSVANGVLAYVFFATVTRALGAETSAPVAVLWAWWSFAGAALTFPLQHWIARQSAVDDGEVAVRRGLPRVGAAVLGVAAVAGAVAWLARERLFGLDGTAFPLLVAAVVVGSAVTGVVRGTLSARRRFAAVGVNLAVENALRCVAALALVLAGVEEPVAYGLALVAGYAACALRPSALVPRATGRPVAAGGATTAPLGFVTGASAGQLLAQAALTGGPVLLAAVGGAPAQVTALFAGLALFRAPYTLAIGLVSALTGRLARLVEDGRRDVLARLRTGLVVATVLVSALAVPLAAWLGPGLMELVFGAGVRLPRAETAVVAVGSVLALANLVLGVGLLARGRPATAARVWLLAAPAGAAAYVLRGGGPLEATTWAFLGVEAAAWVLLVVIDARADRRP